MSAQVEPQLASTVLMVRPVGFHRNPLAAISNTFMEHTGLSADEEQAKAADEFNGLADALTAAGVKVIIVDDTPLPETPDSIFPNNWMSTHADGTLVLYPMQVPNRRPERRDDIAEILSVNGFDVSGIIDLSNHEANEHFLEGTGSLVLDRTNRIAYACLSPRTHREALDDFAARLGYRVIAFDAVDADDVPIYHTNVMMNVGRTLAVVCLESIHDAGQRNTVVESLESTGHSIVEISFAQLLEMAGNMLEIQSMSGDPLIAMSERARRSLSEEQRQAISAHATIVSAPIDNIEHSAGGSVRCMLAEIHLPVKDAHSNVKHDAD